jgi:hypothetical protein
MDNYALLRRKRNLFIPNQPPKPASITNSVVVPGGAGVGVKPVSIS